MHWLRAMNELQMILFDSEVNRRREADDKPPVNSLWFWGGGRLPDVRVDHWRRLVTNDPVALGVGRRAGMETRWLDDAPESPEAADIAEPGTLWIQAGGEQRAPAPSGAQWQALAESLRRGDIERLVLIDPGHGELVIESRHTRSWLPWR
jgi:hypothetical protein